MCIISIHSLHTVTGLKLQMLYGVDDMQHAVLSVLADAVL